MLFLATNLAVILVASVTLRLLGVDQYLYQHGAGINLTGLLIFAAVFGMGGSFVSLLMSKWIAKRSTGAHVIDQPQSQTEQWLVDSVRQLAQEAEIGRAHSA